MSVQQPEKRFASGPLCPACACQHPLLSACPGRPTVLVPFNATLPISGDTKR